MNHGAPNQGSIPSMIQDPLIVTYETDADAIDALSAGGLDEVISARPELQEAIDNGTARIKMVDGYAHPGEAGLR
jgi:hypothetical protein